MTESGEDMEEFDRLRPHLVRVANRMVGSLGEAEDVVQESWLRLRRTDRAEIRDLRAWLTTVVARLALDVLTSACRRHEQVQEVAAGPVGLIEGRLAGRSQGRYMRPWSPEPLVGDDSGDPAERVTLEERVSVALLVVLETLSPAERTAFVLHDIFGFSFPEVAATVGRTAGAWRQLAARARRHVVARTPRFTPTLEEQRRLVEAFNAACAGRDLDALLRVLESDIAWRSQGVGRCLRG